MSKAPAMPMYWDAYLADTTHLTTEEHGAYMLLLAAMWRRNGAVPDDDRDNARILGLTPSKWRKVKARFVATISGFQADGSLITQEKLQKTWEITQEKIDKNRLNGAKGGRAASRENNGLAKANAANSQERKPTIPEPEPEPEYTLPYGSGSANALPTWGEMASILMVSGGSEKACRSILGKWCKSHGRDHVARVVVQSKDSADPVSYVETALAEKKTGGASVAELFKLSDERRKKYET